MEDNKETTESKEKTSTEEKAVAKKVTRKKSTKKTIKKAPMPEKAEDQGEALKQSLELRKVRVHPRLLDKTNVFVTFNPKSSAQIFYCPQNDATLLNTKPLALVECLKNTKYIVEGVRRGVLTEYTAEEGLAKFNSEAQRKLRQNLSTNQASRLEYVNDVLLQPQPVEEEEQNA